MHKALITPALRGWIKAMRLSFITEDNWMACYDAEVHNIDNTVIVIFPKIVVIKKGPEGLLGQSLKSEVRLAQDFETGQWLVMKTLFRDCAQSGEINLELLGLEIESEISILKTLGQFYAAAPKNDVFQYPIIISQLMGNESDRPLFDYLYHSSDYPMGPLIKRTLTFEQQLTFTLSMLTEIIDLHKKNILHRDIKSENFIWDQVKNKAHLIDMGFAIELGLNDLAGFFTIRSKTHGTNGYYANELYTFRYYSQQLTPFFYKHLKISPSLIENPYRYQDSKNDEKIKAKIFEPLEQFYKRTRDTQSYPKFDFINPKLQYVLIYQQLWIAYILFEALIGEFKNDIERTKEIIAHIIEVETNYYQVSPLNYFEHVVDSIKNRDLHEEYFTQNQLQSLYKKLKNLLWPAPCYAPSYSMASETFATGRVIAQIFSNAPYIRKNQRERTELEDYEDILSPDIERWPLMEACSKIINAMLIADPFQRMDCQKALEAFRSIYHTVKKDVDGFEMKRTLYEKTTILNQHLRFYEQTAKKQHVIKNAQPIKVNDTIEFIKYILKNIEKMNINSNERLSKAVSKKIGLSIQKRFLEYKNVHNQDKKHPNFDMINEIESIIALLKK